MSGDAWIAGERRFEDTMHRVRGCAAAIDRATEELAVLRGRARSRCGTAAAEADGRGRLVSLRLADAVTRLRGDEVGELIVATAGAARVDALRRRQEVIAELVAELAR